MTKTHSTLILAITFVLATPAYASASGITEIAPKRDVRTPIAPTMEPAKPVKKAPARVGASTRARSKQAASLGVISYYPLAKIAMGKQETPAPVIVEIVEESTRSPRSARIDMLKRSMLKRRMELALRNNS